LESINSTELRGHVDYLAADALEGREAGTRGGLAAANFLASRLAKVPLRAGGTDGFFQPFVPNYRNVLAVLEGSDPQLKQQYVILGAHYDHIGYGNPRTSLDGVGQIHNGADDNASGTSGVLELIDAFAMLPEPPRRSILFAFWDAEEKGMLGSRHWIAHPTVPPERVEALLNMDMIGRLRNERLLILGTRTGYGLRRLVAEQNQGLGLALEFPWKMSPEADHYPFFERGIPVLMAHTDLHENYHRATDDAPLINAAGMQQVTRLMFGVAYELANQSQAVQFRSAARHETQEPKQAAAGPMPASSDRLGIACERQATSGPGVRIASVTAGSPASLGGLQAEDRVVRFAGREVRTCDELARSVLTAENPVSVVVQRPGQVQPLELTVQLAGAPLRLGITWRLDEAEPGTVILTHVVPGSPAAQAGLEAGDRIYQIADRDFADDTELARLAKTLPGPIRLLVERRGQLRVVEIPLDTQPLHRSAQGPSKTNWTISWEQRRPSVGSGSEAVM
jgi:S1-C subfamily serine protease